jgi:plastin-1
MFIPISAPIFLRLSFFSTWPNHSHYRKYPQFEQGEIFALQDAFRKLDVDDKGYLDEGTVIKATQQSERQPYDIVRQTLKEVELDSSRRVELEDYVDVSAFVLNCH